MMKQIFLLLFLFTNFVITSQGVTPNEIDSLKFLLSKPTHDTIRVVYLNIISREYINYNLDSSFHFANKGLLLSEKIKFLKGSIISHNNVGIVYYYKGNYDKAIENFIFSLSESEKSRDKANLTASLNYLGLAYDAIGNYEKAIGYYEQSLPIRQELKDTLAIALILNNIGMAYTNIGNYKKAFEYLKQSLYLNESQQEIQGILMNLNNIGWTLSNQGQYEQSIDYYLRSLGISRKMNDNKSTCVILDNIAELYLNKSIKKHNRNDLYQALTYSLQSVTVAKEMHFRDELKLIYLTLSKIYEQFQNYQNAYKYHQLFSELKDSIFSSESSKQIAEMQTKYETEKKEKENQILKQEKVIRELKEKQEQEKHRQQQESMKRRNNLQYSVILIVIVALLSGVLLLGKIKVSHKIAEGLIFFVFLILFEFILVFADPYVEHLTGGAPGWKLLINAVVAAGIFPLHAFFEKWLKKKIMKNG